jgi:mycothiol-dependent nitroreductase-like protein
MTAMAAASDLHFYFDPVCPFAWMTSKWVRIVAAQRDYKVDWRFISLRILNAHIDYDAHFPPEYEAGHTAGLRLLRVAARTRAEHGREAVGPLYEAIGTRIFDTSREVDPLSGADQGARGVLEPLLEKAGLPRGLADALDDTSWDELIRTETDEALALTGRDVGTPILHFNPPEGTAFFGPVISRLPSPDDAGQLWDHVIGLAEFGGFAELKRSLRERPQLASLGVDPGDTGVVEDWHGGSRRHKK